MGGPAALTEPTTTDRPRLESWATELSSWRRTAPDIGLDEIEALPGVRQTLLGALWSVRLGRATAPHAELLARHALTEATLPELGRHADLVRAVLGACRPAGRQQVLDDLGPAGSLRRAYVETLARPTSSVARTYSQH